LINRQLEAPQGNRGAALTLSVTYADASWPASSGSSMASELNSTRPSAMARCEKGLSPALADVRLVIDDFPASEVRLARLDATDTASVKGHFDGIVEDKVIVLNGTTLDALDRNGKVAKLGQLAARPDWVGVGTVVVNPQLSQWLYVIRNDAMTTYVHLGTPTSDKVIATLPSPDGNSYYQTYAWIASGVYMVREPVGLGGAGPFLEYHFSLVKSDLTTDDVTPISPNCVVYQILDDGTTVCLGSIQDGRLEIRSPSGGSNVIQVSIGNGTGDYTDTAFIRVAMSPDGKRLIAGRDGSKGSVGNYQMAVADRTSSNAKAFGPLDYLPDAWLPDGRVVADHTCFYSGWGGGPCNASLEAPTSSVSTAPHTPSFSS
jgi:hypothetical protein